MEQNCFFVFYYAHNHFQKVAVFTLQYVRTRSAQYMPSFLTVLPSHQHILYQNIFLHVRIERAANTCYTGILQPLDAVAKLAHVAFSLLGWMSQCALTSKAVDVDHTKEHIYHTQLTRHKSCQITLCPFWHWFGNYLWYRDSTSLSASELFWLAVSCFVLRTSEFVENCHRSLSQCQLFLSSFGFNVQVHNLDLYSFDQESKKQFIKNTLAPFASMSYIEPMPLSCLFSLNGHSKPQNCSLCKS